MMSGAPEPVQAMKEAADTLRAAGVRSDRVWSCLFNGWMVAMEKEAPRGSVRFRLELEAARDEIDMALGRLRLDHPDAAFPMVTRGRGGDGG